MILKTILRVVISLLALIALVLIILLTPTGLQLTLTAVKTVLPGKMEYRRVSGLITGPIYIDDLKYTDQTGSVSIKKIKISWNPFQLFKKKIVINRLFADTVSLNFQQKLAAQKNNTQSLPRTTETKTEDTKNSFPFLLDIHHAEIRNFTLVTRNEPGNFFAPSIQLNVKNPQADQWIIKTQLTLEKPIAVKAEGTITGNPNRYHFNLLAQDKKSFSGQLVGVGNLKQTRFQLKKGEAFGGALSFLLNLQWQPTLQWQLSLQGNQLKTLPYLPKELGPVDLSLVSQGTAPDGPLRFNTLRFNSRIQLTSGPNRLSVTASQDNYLKLNWNVSLNQLSHFWKPFSGTLNTQGRWNAQTRRTEGTVSVQNFSLFEYQGKRLTGQWNLSPSIQKTSQFTVSGEDFKAHGIDLTRFSVSGKGIKTNHQITGHFQISNQLISLQCVGGILNQQWKGELKTVKITAPNHTSWQSTRPARLTVSPHVLKVSPLCLSNPQVSGTLCTSGEWSENKAWFAKIAGNHLDLESLLSPFIPGLSMTSFANVTAKIEGKNNKIQDLQGLFQIGPGTLKYSPTQIFIETPVQEGSLKFQLNGNSLSTQGQLLLAKNNSLSVSLLFPNFTLLDPTTPQTISGKVNLNLMDLSLLDQFFNERSKPTGTFSAHLSVSGSISQPSVTGSVNLINGNIFLPRLSISLEQIKAEISSLGKKLIYTITASSKGGSIQLEGNATWEDGQLETNTAIKGKDFLIMNTPEYTLYASPDMEINTKGSLIGLTGHLTISKGVIQPYELSNVQTLPEDEIIYVGGKHPAIPDLIWKTHMDLQVSVGEAVLLKTKGINARTKGTVSLKQKIGGSLLTNGRIHVVEGEYNAYGRSLQISKGSSIQYINSPIANPNLNIRATRVVTITSTAQTQQLGVNNLIVGINVTGSIQHPRINFFSIPTSSTLSQADILSYLILGYSTQNSGASSLGLILEAANSLSPDGKAAGISGVISEIKQGLGLSELGIESETIVDVIGTPVDQQSSFVIGKQLTKRIYIRYSYGLGQGPLLPVNVFQLRYSLGKNWIIQTDSSNLGSGGDIFYTIETD